VSLLNTLAHRMHSLITFEYTLYIHVLMSMYSQMNQYIEQLGFSHENDEVSSNLANFTLK
jgi:hypothetical protein